MDLGSLFRSLASSDDTAYALSRDRRLLDANDGWKRFALANGGEALVPPPIGIRLDDVLPPSLRDVYVAAIERAFAARERWEHEYECSSPDVFRRFRMVAYPINDELLVCVHSLIVEARHALGESAALSAYAVGGVITTCAHCRRIKNPRGNLRWDWVPGFVAAPPPNLSHGLCEACFEFYDDSGEQ